MNQPTPSQQGLPPPQPLQHPRQAGLIRQQHRPNSPHQATAIQTTQGPYISPHAPTHALSHHQSPYLGTVTGIQSHHPRESQFFGAHPSPYSTNSAAGSYASSEPNENMATQAVMPRQPFPPMSSYQTPQSNSPASIHSPQTDAQGRPLYGGVPSMSQQMYYPQYQLAHQPSYGQHPPASHHSSISQSPSMLISHQHSHPQSQLPPPQLQQQQQSQPTHTHSSMIDSKPSQGSLQRPPSVVAGSQGTPQPPPGPAPGPIPATTPLVVRQDNNGVQWIAFEYSRDRVKMEYTIRCDVENVNVDELSPDFKTANCVYPRACVNKDQYKGNRLHYESECNAVGWALAELNPNLREKRGLIQRAVDSWRNSNQDVRLRSRRVRRLAKVHTRNASKPPSTPGSYSGPSGPASAGAQQSQGLPPGSSRPPNMGHPGSNMHHHHTDGGESGGGGHDVSARSEYTTAGSSNAPSSSTADLKSPTTPRYAQNYYPSYPQPSSVTGAAMPPLHAALGPIHRHSSALTASAPASLKREGPDMDDERHTYGDLPESKRRKFILVDDNQRGARVRVRVTLDQVKMDDMPDAHLRINAVYPRSYFPRQMRSPPETPHGRGDWDDEDDGEEDAAETPKSGKTLVLVPLMDGSEARLPVPRMTKSRRDREIALNEIGYRMSWSQARTFNGRTLFLQRSVDAYRNKVRSTSIAAGIPSTKILAHLETRPGKRKWLERTKHAAQVESPQPHP